MECLRVSQSWSSEIRYYNPGQDFLNQMITTLHKLEDDGIKRENITLLCMDNSQIGLIKAAATDLFRESPFATAGKINLCTIHSYKGLENGFIVIAGPEHYDPHNRSQMSLIFIANTRATAQSIFFLDRRFKTIIEDREDSNL